MGTEKKRPARRRRKSAKNTPRYDRTKAAPGSYLNANFHYRARPHSFSIAANLRLVLFFQNHIKESNIAIVFLLQSCVRRDLFICCPFLKRHSGLLYTCVYPQLAFRTKRELYKVAGFNGCLKNPNLSRKEPEIQINY